MATETVTDPKLPTSRLDSAGQWFNAYDPSVIIPGAATVQTCYMTIPFEHFLRKATFGCTDIDNVGAVGAQLMVAADGAAKAGTLVGTALTDAVLAATTDTVKKFDIALATADIGAVRAAGTTYHMQLSGDNAGDLIEQPNLSICVEPTQRTTL